MTETEAIETTVASNIHKSKLTGKQRAFVNAYLNGANFNATVAAKLAGYKATSKHSFEAIGSENLQRVDIKAAINDFFQKCSFSLPKRHCKSSPNSPGETRRIRSKRWPY